MTGSVVVGLGFGDEGKGLTTDFLCSLDSNTIVVRFSGGHQAGHTVIHNGVKHVFSNYGSGTLRKCPTYFSEHTTFYLKTMVREREILLEKNMEPQLIIHPLAKATTPYDVAYNRLTEQKNRHGSCGLGVAATMKRNAETGYKLHAVDFCYPPAAKQKLEKIKEYYLSIIPPEDRAAFTELYRDGEEVFFENLERKLFSVLDYTILRMFANVIFEGSQGILLDMTHGIFPNVTYGDTTCKNAVEIWKQISIKDDPLDIYGVTRCYQTRHGRGWMSNSNPVHLVNNEEEINVFNQWQENFKVAELDYDLLNYATRINKIYRQGYPHHLVVTCLDQRPDFIVDYEKIKSGYIKIFESRSPASGGIKQVKPFLCT